MRILLERNRRNRQDRIGIKAETPHGIPISGKKLSIHFKFLFEAGSEREGWLEGKV